MTVEMPNHTIYINNLNEKVKVPELKQALTAMFAQFGDILDVVAYKNLACRGQAWVAFKDMSSAAQAIEAMQGFEFYEKPMRITFARTKSDAVAKHEGTFQPRPKLGKGEKRRRAQAATFGGAQHLMASTSVPGAVPGMMPIGMPGYPPGAMPVAAQPMSAAPAVASGATAQPTPPFGGAPPSGPPPMMPTGPPSAFGGPPPPWQPPASGTTAGLPGMPPTGPPPGWGGMPPQGPPPMPTPPVYQTQPLPAPNAAPSAPSGENPPNHILLLTNLPEQTTDAMLQQLFGQYAGLREVRVIPGRHDIAFVEYANEDQAAAAKKELHGFRITPQHAMKIMFAKKGAA